MTTLNPYLYFNGNCEEAFNFYKSAFGGDFKFLGRYKDVPAQESSFFQEEPEKIMHVSLPISAETNLMGCDNTAMFVNSAVSNHKFSLLIHSDDKSEAERLFNCLSWEGQITLPMTETFWGSYYGILTDKFGII